MPTTQGVLFRSRGKYSLFADGDYVARTYAVSMAEAKARFREGRVEYAGDPPEDYDDLIAVPF